MSISSQLALLPEPASACRGEEGLPTKRMKEFIAYVKTNAEKLNVAHAGVGSVTFTFVFCSTRFWGLKPLWCRLMVPRLP